jgi:hypothetical protein
MERIIQATLNVKLCTKNATIIFNSPMRILGKMESTKRYFIEQMINRRIQHENYGRNGTSKF